MSRHGAATTVGRILEDRVTPAFTHQYATMRYQVTYKIAALHGADVVEIVNRWPA